MRVDPLRVIWNCSAPCRAKRSGMKRKKNFYVYEHCRSDTDICFYVGMGRGDRAWNFHCRSFLHKSVVQDLNRRGSDVVVRIVVIGLSRAEALEAEFKRIRNWQKAGIYLTNKIYGGPGKIYTPEMIRQREEHKTKGRILRQRRATNQVIRRLKSSRFMRKWVREKRRAYEEQKRMCLEQA